jgi:hypothetical protein
MTFRAAVKAAADKYIQGSVAPGTRRAYKKEWVRWLTFARERGFWLAPPRVQDLEEYLVLSVAERKSVAVLETVSAAVNWHCAEVGAATPFDDKRISLMVRGMKAEFWRPSQPRLPFTRSHIGRFMTAGLRDNPRAWRAAVVVAVCFAYFLLFSEVSNVRLQDISIKRNSASFRMRKAKNHCLGFDVCLPVDRKRGYCVGAYLVRFLEQALKWLPGDDGFLGFKIEGGRFLPQEAVGYSTLHASGKSLIKASGLDPSRFSTHLAKRGSATSAVIAGCLNAEVTSLGRWRSANTGRHYIHDRPEFRKSLSKRFSL